jgi:hypothetical protein
MKTMKVLYNTCFADPWIRVAKELKEKHNLTPMHWIGNQFDNSEKLLNQVFPDCVYYPRLDLWRGVFPDDIEEEWEKVPFDIDLLRELSVYELQAIKMMDRMDNDQHSFSFMERQRLYRKNLKKWSVYLSKYKPDLVIGAIVPHRAYDYPLYLLCKHLKIPFLFFKNSAFMGRIVHAKDIYSITDKISNTYKQLKVKNLSTEELISGLDTDIIEGFLKVQGDYSDAEPGYMRRHVSRAKQESSILGLTIRLIKLLSENKVKYFGPDAYFFKGVPSYYKERQKAIEHSRLSLYAHIKRKREGVAIKKRLKKYYLSHTVTPDYEKKFVYLPLHYQPEMTSNPSGDIFVDQLLCVDVLSSNLPDDYHIYIKEHPSQFLPHTEGHTSRLKEFYDDLLLYKNVRLMPLNSNPFELTKRAKAVATITGTAGWEAMVLKKPVIIFGLSWYENYDGVLKIQNQASARKIKSFIEGFTFDEPNLLCYLKAFQDNSTLAYYDMFLKDKMELEEEECVGNLVNLVLRCLDIN